MSAGMTNGSSIQDCIFAGPSDVISPARTRPYCCKECDVACVLQPRHEPDLFPARVVFRQPGSPRFARRDAKSFPTSIIADLFRARGLTLPRIFCDEKDFPFYSAGS